MKPKQTFRVIASLIGGHSFATWGSRGMIEFQEAHPDWELTCTAGDRALRPDDVRNGSAANADGYIFFNAVTPRMIRALASTNKPVMLIDRIPPREVTGGKIRSICVDNAAIARVAARHLLSRGRLEHFIYFNPYGADPPTAYDWAAERGAAFRRALSESGFTCMEIHSAESEALCNLPKPLGVFAANDLAARRLVEAARTARLRIPDDIAVVGVDNEIAICENCRPKLSSVRPDYDEEAFHAAILLDRMLHGNHIPLVTIDSSVPEVIERRSTGNPSGSGSLVSRALKIIDTEACQGLTAEALASRLKVSHNLLCLRFREHGGATVRNAIFERKLAEVKRLLRTTNSTIGAIADMTCFGNAAHLMTTFRRHCGCTMAEYRRG